MMQVVTPPASSSTIARAGLRAAAPTSKRDRTCGAVVGRKGAEAIVDLIVVGFRKDTYRACGSACRSRRSRSGGSRSVVGGPPLRDRVDDIPLLVEYFIDRYARKTGKSIRRVNRPTPDRLQSYPWPGNVRELENVIERSVIVCDTDEFTVDESWLSTAPALESRHALSSTLAGHEKTIIEDALRASGGRVFGPSGAAARLGIARSTLESKIRALGINKNGFRGRPAKQSDQPGVVRHFANW